MVPLAFGSGPGRLAAGSGMTCFAIPFSPASIVDGRLLRPARADKNLADNSKTAAGSRGYQARSASFLLISNPAQSDARSAKGAVMCDEQRDLEYYLTKAEDHRQKAKTVSEPRLKAALEEVARKYIAKARALYPSLS